MSMKKEMQSLMRQLEQLGCEVRVGRSGHYRVSRPGHRAITAPATPGDHRSYLNTVSSIRRHLGIDLKGKP